MLLFFWVEHLTAPMYYRPKVTLSTFGKLSRKEITNGGKEVGKRKLYTLLFSVLTGTDTVEISVKCVYKTKAAIWPGWTTSWHIPRVLVKMGRRKIGGWRGDKGGQRKLIFEMSWWNQLLCKLIKKMFSLSAEGLPCYVLFHCYSKWMFWIPTVPC